MKPDKSISVAFAAVLTLMTFVACGDGSGDGSGDITEGTPTASGCYPDYEEADPDNRSSAEEEKESRMYAGSDCMACHSSGGIGTEGNEHLFTVAGTVYSDTDGVSPVQGATVEVEDSDGQVISLTTNSAGNFYTSKSIAFPATTRITNNGNVREMMSTLSSGSCNVCHACFGSTGKVYVEE